MNFSIIDDYYFQVRIFSKGGANFFVVTCIHHHARFSNMIWCTQSFVVSRCAFAVPNRFLGHRISAEARYLFFGQLGLSVTENILISLK